jgi:hypothetical protein
MLREISVSARAWQDGLRLLPYCRDTFTLTGDELANLRTERKKLAGRWRAFLWAVGFHEP